MVSLIRIACIILLIVVGACDSGNHNARPLIIARPPIPAPVPPGPIAAPLVGGTWYGTLVNDVRGTSEEVTALISEDGRFRFLWLDYLTWEHSGALMSGDISFNGNEISATGRAYTESGVVWSDVSAVSNLTIAGTIDRSNNIGGKISGSWSTASGDSGNFELGARIFGGTGSQFNHLVGNWRGPDYARPDRPSVAITVSADGSFLGLDTQGCVHSGRFSSIDSRSDHYDVLTTISDCDMTGTYTGLAIRDGWYGVVYFSVDDGVRPMLLMFSKL